MSRVTIEKKICIEPMYLDKNINNYILEKLTNDVVGKCDQTYGYITKVYKDIQILDNIISSVGVVVFFHVKFNAKALKPEIGDVYTGKVCMIFPNGIFVEVQGKMKVLIPSEKMGEYSYNKKGVFKSKKNVIEIGSDVELEIDLIKYEKQNFNCIGNLKN